MKSVRFHFEAEQELLEHEAWYRQRSEVAAQGFLRPFVNRPSAGQSVAMANIATYSLAIHSRFFTAFAAMRCSSPQSLIKVAVRDIGITASSRRPTLRGADFGPPRW